MRHRWRLSGLCLVKIGLVISLSECGSGGPTLRAQEKTIRLEVLGYQWTTTHQTLTFSWPGYANTSCSGSSNVNGYVFNNGNISANGTSSDTCSTTYTPPSDQTIDIQKPVVFILGETETSRMILTCTRNTRWSHCTSVSPGNYVARIDHGHFEVQGLNSKGKNEWARFDVVQQTAISKPTSEPAPSTIEAPKSESATVDSGFPARWKSMTTGAVRTLRVEGDYIYGEVVLPEAQAKAGMFMLLDLKKDGDKYVGKQNSRLLSGSGPSAKSCSLTYSFELTLITPDRIEGRSFAPPQDAKIDWTTCTFSAPSNWRIFTWIPVK